MQLPIFKTVGKTFGFVVERRFFTLLRLVWFPALLSVVSSAAVLLYLYFRYQELPEWLQPDPDKIEVKTFQFGFKLDPRANEDVVLAALQIGDFFLQLLLGSIIAVCVHRIILKHDDQPGRLIYLRLTGEELRYMVCGVLYPLICLVAMMIPLAAHAAWVFSNHGTAPIDWAQMFSATAINSRLGGQQLVPVGILSLVFALIALARFGLVFPVIVAEGGISFSRSWSLTRGNTLRLIGFWILTVIAASVLLVFLVAVLRFGIGGVGLSIDIAGSVGGALALIMLASPGIAAGLTYLVIGTTLFVAAMSYSYKAIAGIEE